MKKGLDYSWARPTGKIIKNAGYSFVMRYIPYRGNGGKGLEKAELDDLRANGLEIGIVFESTAGRATAGYNAGRIDATKSLKALKRIGLNPTAIYFAVDFNARENQQPVIDDYLRGCASVIGANRVGVYAGYWVIKRCSENKSAKYLWQTYAWSGGNVYKGIHIYQYLNGQQLNGAVDFNKAYKADYGQEQSNVPIAQGDEMFRTDEEVKEAYLLLRGTVATANERRGWLGQSKQRFFRVAKAEADAYRKQLADVKKALTTANNRPPKTVIKEVIKIVEKPVEKIVTVEVVKTVEKKLNWKNVIQFIIGKFNKLRRK